MTEIGKDREIKVVWPMAYIYTLTPYMLNTS